MLSSIDFNTNLRFHNNVKAFCSKYNIQLGTLEEKIGVSTGYLSRCGRMEKDLGLTTAYKIFCIINSFDQTFTFEDFLTKDLYIDIRISEIDVELKLLEERKAALISELIERGEKLQEEKLNLRRDRHEV